MSLFFSVRPTGRVSKAPEMVSGATGARSPLSQCNLSSRERTQVKSASPHGILVLSEIRNSGNWLNVCGREAAGGRAERQLPRGAGRLHRTRPAVRSDHEPGVRSLVGYQLKRVHRPLQGKRASGHGRFGCPPDLAVDLGAGLDVGNGPFPPDLLVKRQGPGTDGCRAESPCSRGTAWPACRLRSRFGRDSGVAPTPLYYPCVLITQTVVCRDI